MFASSFAYNQHGHSGYLLGTVFPDENRTTVIAAQQPNMLTASLECTNGQHKQGSMLHILHIGHIMHILKNAKLKSHRVTGPYHCDKTHFEMHIFTYLLYLLLLFCILFGGVHIMQNVTYEKRGVRIFLHIDCISK
jgi:hypothetical protein